VSPYLVEMIECHQEIARLKSVKKVGNELCDKIIKKKNLG